MKKFPWLLILAGAGIAYYFYRQKKAQEASYLPPHAFDPGTRSLLLAPVTPAPVPIESLILGTKIDSQNPVTPLYSHLVNLNLV